MDLCLANIPFTFGVQLIPGCKKEPQALLPGEMSPGWQPKVTQPGLRLVRSLTSRPAGSVNQLLWELGLLSVQVQPQAPGP